MVWLKISCIGVLSIYSQQPPTLHKIKAYIKKVDADKKQIALRYMQTYGHPLRPGRDTLFWAYSSDFPGSVVIYYSAGKIMKIQETARTSVMFCENIYYFKNGKLLFVKQRQVHCSLSHQRGIWLKNAPFCDSDKDCFFRGSYYFTHDSCFTRQEKGERHWEPHGFNTSGRVAPDEFFPWQAARYVAVFGKAPLRRKYPPNFRP